MEGELVEARAAVLEVLEARFASVSETVRGRVQQTADLDVLRRWRRVAAKAESRESAERAILDTRHLPRAPLLEVSHGTPIGLRPQAAKIWSGT